MSDAKAVIERAKRSGVTIKLKNGKPYAEYVGSSDCLLYTSDAADE